MAEILDYKTVQKLLNHSEGLHVFQVMAREDLLSGRTQKPCVLLISDDDLFYGGITGARKFNRIPKKSIKSVKKVGKLLLTSIEIEYTFKDSPKKVFFCPFTGHPDMPEIDTEELKKLEDLLK
ncbi:MAG: hypothetical protein ABH851_07615 [Methanobacteriota archaeon]